MFTLEDLCTVSLHYYSHTNRARNKGSRSLHKHGEPSFEALLTPTIFLQIYLVSAISLFSLPNLSPLYRDTLFKLALPVMLPVAHIGMVILVPSR